MFSPRDPSHLLSWVVVGGAYFGEMPKNELVTILKKIPTEGIEPATSEFNNYNPNHFS